MNKDILKTQYSNHRLEESPTGDAYSAEVVWSPLKSIWVSAMYLISIIGGYLTFSVDAFLVFLLTTAFTLCLGHSLGMHRLLIHRSYQCPKWLEYFMVHLGVLVGLAGPKGMMQTHDIRDWAQRQSKCHDYFAHRQPLLTDWFWQLHCELNLKQPPEYTSEDTFSNDKVYQIMERTWMLQQLPYALLLFWLGGWAWVVWGICARIAISITGHWFIGYLAHNEGDRHWHVDGAGVQGYNIKFAGLITMGESWHNNHHAFPGSALFGIEKGQTDPGWCVLKCLERLGLVWALKLPDDLPARSELIVLSSKL